MKSADILEDLNTLIDFFDEQGGSHPVCLDEVVEIVKKHMETRREILVKAYAGMLLEKYSNYDLARAIAPYMFCKSCPLNGHCAEMGGESCRENMEAWLKEEEK